MILIFHFVAVFIVVFNFTLCIIAMGTNVFGLKKSADIMLWATIANFVIAFLSGIIV